MTPGVLFRRLTLWILDWMPHSYDPTELITHPEVPTPTTEKSVLSLDVKAVTAAAQTLVETVSVDIFSQSTRSERDRLLMSALIGISITTFVTTSKISLGGLEIDPTVWWGVPVTLLLLNFYFLLTFGSLALSDRRRWRVVAERKANEIIDTLDGMKAHVIERLEQTPLIQGKEVHHMSEGEGSALQQYHLATIKALKEGRRASEIPLQLALPLYFDSSVWGKGERIEFDKSMIDFAAYNDVVLNAFRDVRAIDAASDRLKFSRENTVLVWRLQNAVFVIAPALFSLSSITCLTMFIMKH
jgi:hypothetical protein